MAGPIEGKPRAVKVPYTRVKAGRRYFEPHAAMRSAGFAARSWAEGPDGRQAALKLYEDWLRFKAGLPPAAPDHGGADPRMKAECAKPYPPGSIGAAFQRLIRTKTWADIPTSTRNKAHWPAWRRIAAAWGDADPNTMTLEILDDWQAELVATAGVGVAHKVFKFWRWFWRRMTAMQVARIPDPSLALRNRAPQPRTAHWTEGEAVRLVKAAWRAGEHDVAAVIAVTWDSMFQPGDVRTLRMRHAVRLGDGRLVFDLRKDGRAKTGRAALGTVTPRTEALCLALWEGRAMAPEAFLFRRRDGRAFADHELSEAFRDLRASVFGPHETRQLRDMRRSGALEGQAGGANSLTTSAKMANSIQSANLIAKTYLPVDEAAVASFDADRRKGRQIKRERGGK